MKKSSTLLLPLISGVALWLSFPEFSLYPLAWVALIPYLAFLIKKKQPWKSVFLGHFVMAFVYFGGVLYWIPRVMVVYGGLNWPLSGAIYVLMMLVLSLFLLPFSILTRWAASRSLRAGLLAAPGVWVLTELARNYYAVNGFPWALVGYSQYPFPWIIQIADLGGIYLVSFLIVLVNSALLAAIQLKKWKPLMWVTVVFLAANLYGFYRVKVWKPAAGSPIKAALVQANVELFETKQYYAVKYFESLPTHYRRAARSGAQWVIFPEAQNPYVFEYDFYFKTFWERLVKTFGAYLLFNNTFFEENPSERYFNSALLLNPHGKQSYRYDKMHLVPFGEYVPLKNRLTFAKPLVQGVGAFSAGEVFKVGDVYGTKFATLICYESIFPELSREFANRGAEVFVNITNDSWYGKTAAPRQFLEMAAFRAIENRKPLLRCANSGYSAVIDPWGQIQQQLGLFKEGMLLTQVAASSSSSLYSYIGDWLSILISVLGCLPALLIRKGK